jgi:L-lactate dehydrogenase complex protein LldG
MSREVVFEKIRAALGRRGDLDAGRAAATAHRIENPARHIIPSRLERSQAELVALFKENLTQHAANVLEAARREDIPEIASRFLGASGITGHVRIGSEPTFQNLPLDRTKDFEAVAGPAQADDTIAMSAAMAGVAETGTLVLVSSADNPTTLAFLPDTHLVVVFEETIVGPFEDALDILRAHYGRGEMPRSVNFISAPSRTGDIGGKIVLGAHGPRRLVVIIVKAQEAAV